MLKHSDIWAAIDRLARENGLSASGLARRAGLDPTTFNKSKRTARDGKLRWPSTESVAKILRATGTSLGEFVAYIEQSGGIVQRLPFIRLGQTSEASYYDDAGFPVGDSWDEVEFPNVGDPNAYALEISDNSMAPVYREGDLIVVSPSAGIRRGDRVLIKTMDDQILVKILQRRSARKLELLSVTANARMNEIPVEQVAWIHRILWASQ